MLLKKPCFEGDGLQMLLKKLCFEGDGLQPVR